MDRAQGLAASKAWMIALNVRLGRVVVGRLRADDADRFCFAYASEWLTSAESFPISLSLPLRAEEVVGGAAHAFFSNLLPEGAVRQAVCSRLGISPENDFALLRAIGGECAGALSIVDPAAPSRVPAKPYEYREIRTRQLQELADGGTVPLLIGGPSTRLSLAGAQDKLPVAFVDGRIELPLGDAPSTHILKLPNARFAHLPINEAFVLGLAARSGLDVVKAELVTRTNPPSLLVERYDRRRKGGSVARLHQEDLCQALGLPATRKYEQEGGPNLVRIIELIRAHVRQPLVDVRRVIEWEAFNVVVGNADGHGKNLAILYGPEGELQLAPFYDLVSTRQYKRLDRPLAMSVGGRSNPDEIGRAEWAALGREVGIREKVVLELVEGLVERCTAKLATWTEEFRAEHGNPAILQTLPQRIKRQAKRLRDGLRRRA